MLYELPYCQFNFPTQHICILRFDEGLDVDEEMAIEVLAVIKEYTKNPVYLIFDRSNSYSYQLGALQLLCNRKMFVKICNVVPNHSKDAISQLENVISDRKIGVFYSMEAALLNINQHLLAQS